MTPVKYKLWFCCINRLLLIKYLAFQYVLLSNSLGYLVSKIFFQQKFTHNLIKQTICLPKKGQEVDFECAVSIFKYYMSSFKLGLFTAGVQN